MIPHFPEFKKLELTDKDEIDAYTAQFPPYSDFEFASLWAWNVKEEMGVSWLRGNLVIKFTDYTTGEPFLTFLGTNEVNETSKELLAYAAQGGYATSLQLIPEVSAAALDPKTFALEESRDHFDYVCDIQQHIEYPGNRLKSHRKLLKQFTDAYPQFERVTLDLTSPSVQRDLGELYRSWDKNKGFLTSSEAFAYDRFLASATPLSHAAVGILVDGKMAAFHIASLPPGTCANALFSKADIGYRGIYTALDHVVAQDLIARGYTHMNIQQDLGIENLRKAKLSLHPVDLLKKYSVSLRP